MTSFRRLSTTTAVATLVLVAAGGLVRATGSGLGCLDEWPRCEGSWIAPLRFHAIVEYGHRLVAALVAVLVVSLAATAWLRLRDRADLVFWSSLTVPVIVAQSLLGRVVVVSELHDVYVTAHLLLAMALVGMTTGVAVRARAVPPRDSPAPRVAGMATLAACATLVLLVVGAMVREKGAGLAYATWPLWQGAPASQAQQLQVLHRLVAAAVFGLVVAVYVVARRDPRRAVRSFALAAVVAFGAQATIGGLAVLTRLAPATVLGHVAVGSLAWASVVGLVVAARSGAGVEGLGADASRRSEGSVKAYLQLTKPRIVVLLLVTTIPAMVLASGGIPAVWLVAATLLGGTMTAGSANALNQFLERDIDSRMRRTHSRPLPSHRVQPRRALVFGIALGVLGTVWLAVVVNGLAAAVAAAAIVFYVAVYTLGLKRHTPQNIVIGGAAGAAPVLVGWAAVTGRLDPAAWVMFAIVFCWTPPHFWALAVRYREDYAAAGIPMLPVVRGIAQTARQIFVYSVVLAAVTLVLLPVAGMGVLYATTAVGLGAGFVWLAWRLLAQPTGEAAMRVFRYSISYLALLFLAIAVDGIVGL